MAPVSMQYILKASADKNALVLALIGKLHTLQTANFNFKIFSGVPELGSVISGHVHQVTYSLETPLLYLCQSFLLPNRKTTSEKLCFFWGRVYVTY